MLYAWRSFEAYPIIAATTGATSIQVPNTAPHISSSGRSTSAGNISASPGTSTSAGHGHDLTAMAAAVTDRTRLILVCNPNNPTGTAARTAELDAFLDTVRPDVLVVLDEAYREFVVDDDVPDGVVRYGDRPNVAVLRTMSKAWGLAGLRVGYLIGPPDVVAAVRKVITPFSTSAVAQAAAIAALAAADEMSRRARLVVAERDRVEAALGKLFSGIPPSQANFVWLPLGDRSAAFSAVCERAGIIVRPFGNDGVRVTIGTPEENDAFLAAAEQYLAETVN
jgi:histidinol-phosphate aminotransferase